MKRQDILSILITFCFGFFVGGYIYVTGFAGLVADVSTPDEEAAFEFVVVGDVYGGCRANCPSFQVQGNGSYRYSYVSPQSGERVIETGVLPLKMQRTLANSLQTTALVAQSQEVPTENCNSARDLLDVRYKITLKGAEYQLDSCGTAVVGSSQLGTALTGLWSYFQTVINTES